MPDACKKQTALGNCIGAFLSLHTSCKHNLFWRERSRLAHTCNGNAGGERNTITEKMAANVVLVDNKCIINAIVE